MARTVLTDGSGRWFDKSKAEELEEDTYWNGNNTCSKATGSQWEHETLYRTPGGLYILHHTSSYQGVQDSYTEISHEAAAAWLILNGHQETEELAAIVDELEVK